MNNSQIDGMTNREDYIEQMIDKLLFELTGSKELFIKGRDFYQQYLNSGGEATLKPDYNIVKIIARNNGLSTAYVSKCIDAFLWG